MNAYPYGSRINIQATFRNPLTSALVDPVTVTARVRRPNGPTTVYTYPATITKVSAGIYRTAHTTDMPGNWHYRWEAGGTPIGAGETYFYIRDSLWYP